MQSFDDSLTTPTSNTTSNVHDIFTLKSSNPVYTVQFIKTFAIS